MALRATEASPDSSSDDPTSKNKREPTFAKRTFNWLHEKFLESLTDDVRDLPDKEMYVIGILGFIAGIVIFSVFLSTSFKAAINSSYLVPADSEDSGE